MGNYYLLKQTIPYLKTNINKIYTECNKVHLKNLISFMFGKIEVYYYESESGIRKDLTVELGKLDFNIYEHRFEKLKSIKMTYKSRGIKNEYFFFYTLLENIKLPNIYMHSRVYKYVYSEHVYYTAIFSSDIEEQRKKLNYGSEYEKFIAKKYKELNYNVELNGIKESFNDGGIDVIAKKNKNIILVQCKNWSMSNGYKITQKDLRAFIGDCYIFLKNLDNAMEYKISFHFIVSHEDILTTSAKIFLEKNTFIKFKAVPFADY